MRDYDPTLGRYLQADPLGLVDGASVYGYALQNPGRYTDFMGLYGTTGVDPAFLGNLAGGFGSYVRGVWRCLAGGCSDPRPVDVLTEFKKLYESNPELKLCLQRMIKSIESDQMVYAFGRGVGPTITTTFGLKGSGFFKKIGSSATLGIGATYGDLSHFLTNNFDSSPEQIGQVFAFGKVLLENFDCGCGDDW